MDSITGENSGTNLGPGTPIIHFEQWENDDEIEVKLILKGGGCENMNAQYSLPTELPQLGRADRTLDGDGIADNVRALDTDMDGIPDAADLDSDNDGVSDLAESANVFGTDDPGGDTPESLVTDRRTSARRRCPAPRRSPSRRRTFRQAVRSPAT